MSPDMSWLGHQIIRIIAISDLNMFNFEKLRAVGIAASPISTKRLHRVGCPGVFNSWLRVFGSGFRFTCSQRQ